MEEITETEFVAEVGHERALQQQWRVPFTLTHIHQTDTLSGLLYLFVGCPSIFPSPPLSSDNDGLTYTFHKTHVLDSRSRQVFDNYDERCQGLLAEKPQASGCKFYKPLLADIHLSWQAWSQYRRLGSSTRWGYKVPALKASVDRHVFI